MPETPTSGDEIYADLRAKIASGELSGRIPTRDALAEQYGVSAWTIGRIVARLKAEGLLGTRGGNGTWVTKRSTE